MESGVNEWLVSKPLLRLENKGINSQLAYELIRIFTFAPESIEAMDGGSEGVIEGVRRYG